VLDTDVKSLCTHREPKPRLRLINVWCEHDQPTRVIHLAAGKGLVSHQTPFRCRGLVAPNPFPRVEEGGPSFSAAMVSEEAYGMLHRREIGGGTQEGHKGAQMTSAASFENAPPSRTKPPSAAKRKESDLHTGVWGGKT